LHRFGTPLILIALCLATLGLAACGGGGSEDPRQIVESASFEGIESADFEGSLKIDSKGSEGGELEVGLSGRVRAAEGIDIAATVKGTAQGKAVDFEGGLTLFDDHGFVSYQGTEYEIDPSNYSFAKPLFFPILAEEGGAEARACKRAASEIQAGQLVGGLRDAGTADVDGTSTTKVSGELDVPAAVDAMLGLTEDLGCSVQVEALSPLPRYRIRRLGDELAASAGKAKFEIYVGDDDIVRKVSAEFTADPKGGRQPIAVDLELVLSEVNADRKIEVPAGAKPVSVLFGKLGVSPLEFLNWSRGGEGVRSLGEKVAADAFP
jgi:hypothetical protein